MCMMTEISDLEGIQKRCPPKEDQHKKKKKKLNVILILDQYCHHRSDNYIIGLRYVGPRNKVRSF